MHDTTIPVRVITHVSTAESFCLPSFTARGHCWGDKLSDKSNKVTRAPPLRAVLGMRAASAAGLAASMVAEGGSIRSMRARERDTNWAAREVGAAEGCEGEEVADED